METELLIANNEAGFKALFTHATVGIIMIDQGGCIINANPFICKMLNYLETEFIGKDISILIPENLREKHKAHIHSYFIKPISRPMGRGMELKAVRKTGEEIYVEISLCSYFVDEENIAVAFVTDVTKQKFEAKKILEHNENLEKIVHEQTYKLRNALEKEQQANQVKTRFVSLASHEFRTPLSTIVSSTSLINKYNENIGSENIEKHTCRIKNAVNNLVYILNDFLSIDKLEQGAVRVNPESFHLPRFCEEICEEIENYLKPGQTIMREHIGGELMYTDKKLIKNILLNLLSNASKYSDERKNIFIKTSIQENSLKVQIIDEGIGIPKEEQEKLFSLFYRGSNVGSVQGTGLGLNIVSKYISILGGQITVSSIENVGSTFTISLPPIT